MTPAPFQGNSRGRGRGSGRGRGVGRGRGGRGGGSFRQPEGPPDFVTEIGVFTHPCENQLVCKSSIEKVPMFNAPIYLENKEQIGSVDEIFGSIRNHSFSVKLSDNMKASSFKIDQKLYVNPMKLLPIEKFLPKSKGAKPSSRGGARGRVSTMSRGRGGFDRGGRSGRGGQHGDQTPGTCFKCGEAGHMSRECPKGGANSCFKCGEQGHMSRECPKGGQTPGTCFKCGEKGHMSRECPKGGQTPGTCFKCGEAGHMSRECPQGGGTRGGRGGRGGFDRGGRGGRGGFGQKRSYGSSGDSTPQNKKIKFDN